MDLLLMRSLVAVAAHGTITKAADALGITQPALTRRIQQLEEEFGAPLLARSRRGVVLTEMGRVVEREARALIERYEHLKAEVDAQLRLEAGTVRLGGGATAISFVVPPAIAALKTAYPGIRFQVKEAGSREVEQDVADERLDVGIVTPPVRSVEMDVEPLLEDRIVLVGARGHPLVRGTPVSVEDLSGHNLVAFEGGSAIRQIVDGALREAGVEMNVVMELRSIPAILRMVTMTGDLAFVSRLAVVPESPTPVIEVRDLEIRRRLVIVSKRGRPLSPAARAFADRLRSHTTPPRPPQHPQMPG